MADTATVPQVQIIEKTVKTEYLSTREKYYLMWQIFTKCLANIQRLVVALKVFRSRMQAESGKVRGFVPDLSKILDEFSQEVSGVINIPAENVRLFVKQYLVDSMIKKGLPEVSQERREEILYRTFTQGINLENFEFLLVAKNHHRNELEKVHRTSFEEHLVPLKKIQNFLNFSEKTIAQLAKSVDATPDEVSAVSTHLSLEFIESL